MTKKIFIGILVSILLSLCTSFCFAATDTDKVNLGNDVSSSINKGMDSVGNAVRDVAGFGERTVDNTGDAIGNMGNNNARNNNSRTTNGMNTNGMYNGNYNTTRTSADGTATTAGMSTTTWMWVIFAIAAVIIIAAIWYYAMQGNDRD